MEFLDPELRNYAKSTMIHRFLFVTIMKLEIFGNPGYMVPCNKFANKHYTKLMSGEKLWQ
jgi:hypothetical protein